MAVGTACPVRSAAAPSSAGRRRMQVRAVGREGSSWRALPKFPRDAGEPVAEAWPGPRHVIFGHHARRRLQARHPAPARPGLPPRKHSATSEPAE